MGVTNNLARADANGELVGFVEGFIRKQGGVSGLVSKFETQGLGAIARSWTAAGENHPISAAQLQRVLGFETLTEIGTKIGLSADAVAAKLADLLPKTVDKLTVRTGAVRTGAASSDTRYPWTGTRSR